MAKTRTATPTVLLVVMLAGVLTGVLIRMSYVLSQDFPVNDGGMFVHMTRELLASDFRLPAVTSYNQTMAPFAYPPLGFYVTAAVAHLTGVDAVDLVHMLPLVVTILTLPAFALLARALLVDVLAVGAAVVCFALIPRTFLWFIMGGGVTRAFGFLFAILALRHAHAAFIDRSVRARVSTALLVALTALSHLGILPFLGIGLVLMWVFYGKTRATLFDLGLVGLGAAIVSAPWWATVMSRHGVAPFLAAQATGGSILGPPEARQEVLVSLAYLGIGGSWGGSTGEVLFPVIGAIALLGAVFACATRQWFLPAWWLAVLLVDARAGINYATVPVALLAGMGIRNVLFPLVGGHQEVEWARWLPRTRHVFMVGLLLAYSVLSILLARPSLGTDLRALKSLTKDERAAMRWVAEHTAPSSTFLVIPQDRWGVDRSSEWFPVLTGRTSVATVQGTEWLPDGAFAKRRATFVALEACAHALSGCVEEWAQKTGMSFTHVFVPQSTAAARPCCPVLIASLERDTRYREVYPGPGGKVFVRE